MKSRARLASLVSALSFCFAAACGSRGSLGMLDAPGPSNPSASSSPGRGSNGGSGGGAPSVGGMPAAPRAIQEADIYKLVGNTLHILNATNGLEIVDVTDVQSPQILARVPAAGAPREVYVEGNTAYVLVSGAYDYNCGAYQGVCGWTAVPNGASEVLAVDVSSPAAPKLLGSQQINGDLQDSRIVGSILYVVGVDAGAGDTFVESYDVSNPAAFQKVDEADFAFGDWDIGVFINVSDSRIVVAQTGDTCDLVQDDGSACDDSPVTQFVPIDITNPSGKLNLGTSFLGNGVVWDRWAMDFDPGSGLFRALMSSDWNSNSGGGVLTVWSAPSTTSAPTVLGNLSFTTGDNLTAAAFAGPRVYVSSNTQSTGCPDPIVVLDTTNPSAPVQLGSVAAPGVNDFLYPDGNQLITLGHADPGTSNACGQGQNYISFQGSGQLAVSLFDVSDPSQPKFESQVTFGGAASSIAASRDNLKKAFLVLDTLGLILVPFQNVDPATNQPSGGTQLIDLNAASLTLRGMASQQGLVERAFPVQSDVVAFSEQWLQVIDITNQDRPATVTQLGL
ncbi:MAG: beta-propeller domain-containing protein [Myxococcales bacterium]